MDILKQLEEGKPFSGGAFTGRVEPQSIEGDTLKVICGTRWHENYSMLFERGDYYFL